MRRHKTKLRQNSKHALRHQVVCICKHKMSSLSSFYYLEEGYKMWRKSIDNKKQVLPVLQYRLKYSYVACGWSRYFGTGTPHPHEFIYLPPTVTVPIQYTIYLHLKRAQIYAKCCKARSGSDYIHSYSALSSRYI